jgi:Tfp pilus assembly protein PilZ
LCIYSSSFTDAKVVSNIKSGLLNKLQQANNMVSLRFCFKNPDNGTPVPFFVSAKCLGYTPYGDSKDAAVFNLQFTQRPPDDLIEIMGRMLDANINSAKRKDERILITPESIRRLHLSSKDTAVFIQQVPRRCILRDLSFSGAKIIMMGVSKFLVDKDVALRIDFDDPREAFLIPGKFVRAEDVEGRKELLALGIVFNEKQVPMAYKIRINDYLGQVKVENRGDQNTDRNASAE